MSHFWDPNAASGRWFADNMPWDNDSVPAWDVFYLFGADATWDTTPEPLTQWGYTIVGHRDDLEEALEQVVG